MPEIANNYSKGKMIYSSMSFSIFAYIQRMEAIYHVQFFDEKSATRENGLSSTTSSSCCRGTIGRAARHKDSLSQS